MRVLVALSGGIDSAAVVMLLRDEGYSVEALYIDMMGDERGRLRATELAAKLEVKLYIEPAGELFTQQVVGYTLAEHQAGRTPSPCARCNPMVKWRVLADVADRLGLEYIATGHYVNICKVGADFFVSKGIDLAKDQSYYLWALGQDILARAITPLGKFYKTNVRQYLREAGFEQLASGGESMGLCFLRGLNYNEFLRQNLAVSPGQVVDERGDVVGEHDGYQLYTAGQKRGFRSSVAGEIRRIDPLANRIEVGKPLYCSQLEVENYVLHGELPDLVSVKVRGLGRNPQGLARVSIAGARLRVELLDDTAWAPAVGQPVVLYDGQCVVGGGVLSTILF